MPGHGGGGGGFGGGSHSGSHGTSHGSTNRGTYHGYPAYHVWGYGGMRRTRGLCTLFAPLAVFTVLTLVFLFLFLVNVFHVGGISAKNVSLNEDVIEEYADKYYYEAFGSLDDTEDEILLIFLVNQTRDGYFCITWVGDHIAAAVDNAFGDEEGSTYFYAVTQNVSDNFGKTLEDDIADVVNAMQSSVTAVSSSYLRKGCAGDKDFAPVVFNLTDIPSSKSLRTAMQAFTEITGIPLAVVIDEEGEVVRESEINNGLGFGGAGLLMFVIAVWLLVDVIKSKRKFDGLTEQQKEQIKNEDDFNRSDNYY